MPFQPLSLAGSENIWGCTRITRVKDGYDLISSGATGLIAEFSSVQSMPNEMEVEESLSCLRED